VQFHAPPRLPSEDMLLLAHAPEYVRGVLTGTLSDAAKRRIGFQDSVDSPVLIARALSEVSGADELGAGGLSEPVEGLGSNLVSRTALRPRSHRAHQHNRSLQACC